MEGNLMKRVFHKSLSVFLAFALVLTLLPVFSLSARAEEAAGTSAVWDGTTKTEIFFGSGTSEDPYVIDSAQKLALLAAIVNGNTCFNVDTTNGYTGNETNGTYTRADYVSANYKLTTDIVLNDDTSGYEDWSNNSPDHVWTPIGTLSSAFSGTFDGQGHTVSGIYINGGDYLGLFGYISGGTVENIGVADSNISGRSYIGGVAGYNYGGQVTNCGNSGCITALYMTTSNDEVVPEYCYAGGVVGYNCGGQVTNCHNSGTITSTGMIIGGVVGYTTQLDALASSTDAVVDGCWNTGSVIGGCYFGGVVGENYINMNLVHNDEVSLVENCWNAGAVSVNPQLPDGYMGPGNTMGGVVGQTGTFGGSPEIKNCYNIGSVTSENAQIGGVVGRIFNSSSYAFTVSNCYNAGQVTGCYNEFGGITGMINDRIVLKDCYNSGAVLTADGTIGGGIAGANAGTVTDCYYDKQICTFGGIGGSDIAGSAEGMLTGDMTSGAALTGFDSSVWTYASGLYPRLSGMDGTDAAYVSASPAFLAVASDTVYDVAPDVVRNFTVSTGNSVLWSSDNTAAVSIADGSATVTRAANSAAVNLTASLNGVSRTVSVTVAGLAPSVLVYSPVNGSSGSAADTPLSLTFREPVSAVDGKNISIKCCSDDSTACTIPVSSASISGNTVTIPVPGNLEKGRQYYVTIDEGAFINAGGYGYAGISDKTVWSFAVAFEYTYLITRGEAPASGGTVQTSFYDVYKKNTDGSFSPFEPEEEDNNGGFSSIRDAVDSITDDVDGDRATIIFGLTGTSADTVAGTLTTSKGISLGDSGTYTLKGALSGEVDDDLIRLSDASLIVDGAHISSEDSVAVENEGSGTLSIRGDNTEITSGALAGVISSGPVNISGGTITGPDNGPALICTGGEISSGTLRGNNAITSLDINNEVFPGVVFFGGVSLNSALVISGGTIENTASAGYAVYGKNMGSYPADIYLSGRPSISAPTVCVRADSAIYADNGAALGAIPYMGNALTLCYGGDSITPGTTVAVSHVTQGTNEGKFSLTNPGCGLLNKSTNLVIGTLQVAPAGLTGVKPTSENGTDGSISGTTAAMEYKLATGSGDYTACTGSSTTVGAAGNYLVRYAATDTLAASSAVTVYVPPYMSHSVSGTVDDSSNNPLSGATVKVMQGSTQFGGTATTGADGSFTVSGIPDGEYNLVVTSGDRTVTQFITVSGQDLAAGIITLPNDQKNSVLDVQGTDTPAVVVNGLDAAAAEQTDNSCTVTMTVTKKEADDSDIATEASHIISIAGGQSLRYLKIEVTKKVGNDAPASLTSLTTVQEIVVPYDFSGKTDVTVYRCHDSAASALTALRARPALSNAADDTFYANSADGKIYIYASKFSTYAIGYSTGSGGSNPGGGLTIASYTVTASAGAGGSISPMGSTSVPYGGSKTFTIKANDGYYISDVLVDGKSVGAFGSYTFSNVTSSHTLSAAFAKAEGLPYYLDNSDSKVFIGFASDKSGTMKYIAPKGKTVQFIPNSKSFTDISGHWAQSDIDFVTQREIFVGTGTNVFSPDTGMTRSMFAAVIGRLYERSFGTLTDSSEHVFTDVNDDVYYGRYVNWASQNKIITGVGGGLFEPDRKITREEMAAILYRFAEFMGASSADYANTQLAYPDKTSISSWAVNAAGYCQSTGIIQGRDGGYFVPKGTATRAEVAVILERFIKIVVD